MPLKLTRRSDGVVVGGAKPVPLMVTPCTSQCASGPVVTATTVGSLFVIWKAPSFVVLCSAPTLVTVRSRTPGEAPKATLRVAVIRLGLSTLTPAVTPGPKEAVASLAKLAPAMMTTRPVAPWAAVVGATDVMIGPAADVKIVAFCTLAGVTPGLGPEIVVSNAADVTPSGRKPGDTSTAIPEMRMVAFPDVEATASVKETVPELTVGVLSTAPPLSLKETVGVPLKTRPAGRLTVIGLPVASPPVAFSAIWMSPIAEPWDGATIAGLESAVSVVPVFELTLILTVAGALVRGAAQVGPGGPHPSGSPRSVTVKEKVSSPEKLGFGV